MHHGSKIPITVNAPFDETVHLPQHNAARAAKLQGRPPWFRRLIRLRAVQLAAAALLGANLAVGAERVVHQLTAADQHPPAAAESDTIHVVTEVTPAACLDALGEATAALQLAAEFGQGMRDLHRLEGGVHSFRKGGKHHAEAAAFIKNLGKIAKTYGKHADRCASS